MTGYVRSRQLVLSAVGTVVALVLTIAFYHSQLTLHFDPDGSVVRMGLLSPIVFVMFINVSLNDPVGEAEAIFRSRTRMLRSAHMAAILTLVGLGTLTFMLAYGVGAPMGQFVRNSACLIGLLLLTAALVSSQQAWVLPMTVVLATYGFGMDYSLGAPHGWALLLEDHTTANLLVGLVLLVVGAACFIGWGPKAVSVNEVEM